MNDPDETDLTDFGFEGEPTPLVERKALQRSPHTNRICGFIGHDRARDLVVYATVPRGTDHYYRDGDGWALSVAIQQRLAMTGVSRILIHDGRDPDEPYAPDGDIYEFTPRQFADGRAVPPAYLVERGDVQTFVPIADARAVYERLGEDLFVRPFDAAIDYITDRTRR